MPRFFVLLIILCYLFGSVFAEVLFFVGYIQPPFYQERLAGSVEYLYLIASSVVLYLSILGFSKVFGLGKVSITGMQYPNVLSNNIVIVIILAYFLYGTLLLLYYYPIMQLDVTQRHSGNQQLPRLTFLFMLIAFYAASKFNSVVQFLLVLGIIFVATLYPSMTASRAVALPFIVAAFLYLSRKQWFYCILFLYLSLVALYCAFDTRSLPSYSAYWSSFSRAMLSFDLIRLVQPAIQYSIPGASTLIVVLSEKESFTVEKFFEFIVLISPLPSTFLTESMISRTSISALIGINIFTLGINVDIYSEGAYWFGFWGVLLYPIFLGFYCVLPFKAVSLVWKVPPAPLYYLALLTVMYMIIGGMVFTLRAGSRLVLAFVLILFAVYILGRARLNQAKVAL